MLIDRRSLLGLRVEQIDAAGLPTLLGADIDSTVRMCGNRIDAALSIGCSGKLLPPSGFRVAIVNDEVLLVAERKSETNFSPDISDPFSIGNRRDLPSSDATCVDIHFCVLDDPSVTASQIPVRDRNENVLFVIP